MQSSQTTHDLNLEDNAVKSHKPVKHVRSHEGNQQQQQQRADSTFRNNRSLSSNFRHSIRNLTSCALARRKSSRNNDQEVLTVDSQTKHEDDHRRSLKSLLIPSRASSSSPSHKKYSRQSTPIINDDTPPPIPTRKSLKEKHSIPTTSNTPAVNTSSPEQSIKSDDLVLSNLRRLSNKEISTSLVDLMGTATDTVPCNNLTQISTNECRHISSTPAASVDRLGLFGSTSNVGGISTLESPIAQRTGLSSVNLSAKSLNDYSWCYESSNSTTNGFILDEHSPRLEVDDKPLIYREQFKSTEHFNWYGVSDSQGPVIISYKYSNDDDKQRYIMAIVRTRHRTSIESILDIISAMTYLDILKRICDQCSINDIEYFDPVLCDGTHEHLTKYDESHVSTKHKFGVIYQRENQLTEEDLFSNETHSLAMSKFLDLIGSRVKLKDFQGFRGGLDVKTDQTGLESIYEQFNNHEIMFHVSTLLPHSKIERQQLERKRHIGNDIVAIIFQEHETQFNPECIASQFLHVYLVVTPLDSQGTRYKVSAMHRDSVPAFGPSLQTSNIFHRDQTFKQWILTKLINAELASCRANTFQKYQERTKINLFENLYKQLHEQNRLWMNLICHQSQFKHECDVEHHKEDAHAYSSTKGYDRHSDNSLLGSVRRRFIAPKLRSQQQATPTTLVVSPTTSQNNDSKSKSRSMTMDLNRSASKDSVATNGKMISMFSISKQNHSLRMEKSNTQRSLLDTENPDLTSPSSRSNSKYLLSVTSPSTPSNDCTPHDDTFLPASAFDLSKLSFDDANQDPHSSFIKDNFQSSTKDDLIKYIIALQQQHSTKLAQLDEQHSKAMKQLELQLLHQQHSFDTEN